MAQPNSNSALYFSHDADMRNDIKVKALRRQFQHKGYAVWCFILETLTGSDNFETDYDEVSQELLAADYEVTADDLRDIVDYCVRIGLLQVSDGKLYSEAHKRRFAQINEKRESLRSKRSQAGKLGMQKRWGHTVSPEQQEDNDVITDDNNAITLLSKPITKITKEKRKEEKRKEKKTEYPYQDIVRLWNDTCLALPKVRQLNDNRRNKIRCRLTECGAETTEQMIEWAQELFSACQSSDFLRGDNKSHWQATFDWVFENSTNWVKVSEGNYANNRGSKSGFSGVERPMGVGEYMTPDGRRTYGSGHANIPLSAPPRPSERHQWSAESGEWILL